MARLRALVTGGGGFIGRALLVALEARSWEIVPVLGRLAEAENELGAIRGHFDVAFHLAGHTPKSAGPEDVERILEANVEGLHALLDALDGRTRALVYASTLDVYSQEALREPLSETSALGPRSLYGASKWIGEETCRAWGRTGHAAIAVLRLTHTYGPGESAYRKLIPEAIRCGLQGRPFVLRSREGDLRDLLYVADAAEALVLAGEAATDREVGTLNVASGRSMSVEEILARIGEELPRPLLISPGPDLEGPAQPYRFDVTRLRATLGFEARMPLREGLRREIDWFRGQVGQ